MTTQAPNTAPASCAACGKVQPLELLWNHTDLWLCSDERDQRLPCLRRLRMASLQRPSIRSYFEEWAKEQNLPDVLIEIMNAAAGQEHPAVKEKVRVLWESLTEDIAAVDADILRPPGELARLGPFVDAKVIVPYQGFKRYFATQFTSPNNGGSRTPS